MAATGVDVGARRSEALAHPAARRAPRVRPPQGAAARVPDRDRAGVARPAGVEWLVGGAGAGHNWDQDLLALDVTAVLTGRGRQWQHGRFWVNDPDCLLARPAVERREAWAAHVAAVGGLVASSDRLRDLDGWGLETTRRQLDAASTFRT